jgi:DNA invertase Pin-like site-specific DNA recombinase
MSPSNTSTVFGYCRASTTGQATENQKLELQQAGYGIRYLFQDEGVSGKRPAAQRPAFQDLLSKIRKGETLVVSKMDRLGRDAIDVLQTVRQLQEKGVHVIVHQLGNTDLTSPAGKLLLFSALAEMERDLLVERTQAGSARAKSEGKKLGRKAKTDGEQREEIRKRLEAGEPVSAVARAFDISRANVIGIRDRG